MPKAPTAEGEMDAQAKELNPRGYAYRYNGKEFSPGEWVAVDAEEALRLQGKPWIKLRPREMP